jgi:hypothetical protein
MGKILKRGSCCRFESFPDPTMKLSGYIETYDECTNLHAESETEKRSMNLVSQAPFGITSTNVRARKNPGKPKLTRVSLLSDRIIIRSCYHGGGAVAVAPPPPFCKPESAGGVAGGGAEILSGLDTVLSCPPQPTKLSVTSNKPNPIKRFMPFPFLGS